MQAGPEGVDKRGEIAAGRGHRHVRRVGPKASRGARAHQKAVSRDSDATGSEDDAPQGGRLCGHASAVVRRPEHGGRSVRGWWHPAARRNDQVDGLSGGVLRQGPVQVRQVQAVLPIVPGHFRVHAAVDGHDARDDDRGRRESDSRGLRRPQVSCSGDAPGRPIFQPRLDDTSLEGAGTCL